MPIRGQWKGLYRFKEAWTAQAVRGDRPSGTRTFSMIRFPPLIVFEQESSRLAGLISAAPIGASIFEERLPGVRDTASPPSPAGRPFGPDRNLLRAFSKTIKG